MNSMQKWEEQARQRMDEQINRSYCLVEKDQKGKVIEVKVCEPIQANVIAELKSQAHINKVELDKERKEQELNEIKAEELKERKLERAKVISAYFLYFIDTIDNGAVEGGDAVEEWFAKYRNHETDEVIESPLFEKYLKEVDL